MENFKKVIHGQNQKPTIIKCNNCGENVMLLNSPTITCSCGTDYNCFGQELAPREQWGWETGESLTDIINGRDSGY